MVFKVSPDLFIGSQELNRLIKFLDDDGFRRLLLQNSFQFGVVNNSLAGVWDNFRVSAGTNPGTVKLTDGVAIDQDGQLLIYVATDNLAVINDSQWYWLTVTHQYDHREVGLCSVDASGNLTLPAGGLLNVLRGLPNNPVVVSFPDASLNTQEYEVNEVLDDTHAVLAGDFQAETNLRLAVVGAFTPDTVTPPDSKYPYQYDSCLLSFVLETISDTPPVLVSGTQFTIARIKRTGGAVVIQDKRTSVYQTRADFDLRSVGASTNPLVGVEQVNFDNQYAPRNVNLLRFAWGLRSSNWTIDSSTNKVTLLGGKGGKYKTTADFVDGDFDGWRVYTKSGRYSVIRQSSISALQINLILDTLDPDDYVDTTQELHVVPDCEQVEIIATVPGGASTLTEQRFTYPVNEGYATVPLEVYAPTSCEYVLSYRYKKFGVYSQEALIPDDNVVGYYIETSFDADGVLTGSAKHTYVDGQVTLLESPNSYRNTVVPFLSRDLFGMELLALDNALPNNVRDFVVGTRKQNVVITQDPDLGDSDDTSALVFSVNQFLNLRTDSPIPMVGGTSFIVKIQGSYTPGAYSLRIVQDWVSSIDPGTVLYTLTTDDYEQAANNNLNFRFLYDAESGIWLVTKFISLTNTDGIKRVLLNLGVWNMTSTGNIVISLAGITTWDKVVKATAMIRQDGYVNSASVSSTHDLAGGSLSDSTPGGFLQPTNAGGGFGSNSIYLQRYAGGFFTLGSFASAVINRGTLLIEYHT